LKLYEIGKLNGEIPFGQIGGRQGEKQWSNGNRRKKRRASPEANGTAFMSLSVLVQLNVVVDSTIGKYRSSY
jgi:hypothetical protein